jgi:hypothetical protein
MKKYLFAALLIVGLALVLAPTQAFAQEDKPFTVHGEVRFGGEYDNNATDFDKNSPDGGLFWPYRVRIAVEGKFTKNVDGYVEVQSLGVAGGDTSLFTGLSTEQNPRWAGNGSLQDTGLYQGYVTLNELFSKSFSLRLGRQEIVAGNKFLLGDEEWYGGISHDGIVGMWHLKKVDIKGWYTRPFDGNTGPIGVGGFQNAGVPPGAQGLGNAPNVDFLGGYATFTVHKDWGVDVYAMDVNDRGPGAVFQTFGARFDHETWEKKGLVWNIEYAMQAGHVAGGSSTATTTDVKASGSAAEALIGWNFHSKKKITHRIYGRYEFASGDKIDPVTGTGDKFEGFVPLYGDVHGRTGNGDWFQVAGNSSFLGSNSAVGSLNGQSPGLKAWSVGYNGMFNEKHDFGVAYWDYSSDQKVFIFDSSNPNATSSKLGTAFDVWYGYNYSKNVAFQVDYSELSPGKALTGTGTFLGNDVPNDSVNRLYARARLRF